MPFAVLSWSCLGFSWRSFVSRSCIFVRGHEDSIPSFCLSYKSASHARFPGDVFRLLDTRDASGIVLPFMYFFFVFVFNVLPTRHGIGQSIKSSSIYHSLTHSLNQSMSPDLFDLGGRWTV